MSNLVRLYPQAWRDRYETEFVALLEERPLTARDVLDTLRGAVDAHLHPHLVGDVEPSPWTHRIPGLLALAGGAIYLASIVGGAFAGGAETAWSSLVGCSLMLMFLSLPGDYTLAHGRRIALILGLLLAIVLAANVAGWSVPGMAFAIVGFVIAFGGMLALAAIRAEIRSAVRWLLLVTVVVVPITVPVAITILVEATGSAQPDVGPVAALAILVPYGVAWLLIGLRMTIRGAPTIIDPPLVAIEAVASEDRPA